MTHCIKTAALAIALTSVGVIAVAILAIALNIAGTMAGSHGEIQATEATADTSQHNNNTRG